MMDRGNRAWIAGGVVCLLLSATLVIEALGRSGPTSPEPAVAVDAPAGPFVAVVFRLADCGGSIERLAAWNRVHAAGEVPVVGLVLDGPGEGAEVRRALDGAGISFPLQHVNERRMTSLLRAMGHTTTPAALLFDAWRRVRMAVPLDDAFRPADVRAMVAAAGAPVR